MIFQFTGGGDIHNVSSPIIDEEICRIIYCQNVEHNKCKKKETCKRYLQSNPNSLPLFKEACNQTNNYQLYIQEAMKDEKQTS